MKNLALQGESRHFLPLTSHKNHNFVIGNRVNGSGNIVAVIQCAQSHHKVELDEKFERNLYDENILISGGCDIHKSFSDVYDDKSYKIYPRQPPVVFVLTSEGYLFAIDESDKLVWTVDLEKVVEGSKDESEEERIEDVIKDDSDTSKPRSLWFYASSFSPASDDDIDDNPGSIRVHLTNERDLHLTCLSRAGYVVSVSIDATNSLISANENVEGGSECIGTFECGLECGEWSPDGEVLALVTFTSEDENGYESCINNTRARVPILMTMNSQYEILSEVRLEPCLFSLNYHDNQVEVIHPSNVSLCWRPDSSSLALSCLEMNATSNNDRQNSNPIRRIRTYNRVTLELLSLSKEEDGSGRDVPNLLPVAPAWAPAGCSHYVAAAQSVKPFSVSKSAKCKQMLQVAFMEPNGLRHRECKIQNTGIGILGGRYQLSENEEIVNIAFNLNGDLLAVSIMVIPLSDNTSDLHPMSLIPYGKLQLYHQSNYQWYLKYELRYDDYAPSSSAIISKANFSDNDPYKIVVALDRRNTQAIENTLRSLEWREYTFRWEPSTIYYNDNSFDKTPSVLAMVIDGKTLHFTPLDKALIPPPLYGSSLELPAPIVSITCKPHFSHELCSNSNQKLVDYIVITMSNRNFAVLIYDRYDHVTSSSPSFDPPKLLTIIDPLPRESLDETEKKFVEEAISLRDMIIIDSDSNCFTIAALTCSTVIGEMRHFFDYIIEMKLSFTNERASSSASKAKITMIASFPILRGRALRLVNWLDTALTNDARKSALLELADGTLLKYSEGGVFEPSNAGHMLEACPWIVALFDARVAATLTSNNADRAKDLQYQEPSKCLVVGLSSRSRLYCSERLISSASSSFGVSLQHRFLIHVTLGSRPLMRFLSLNTLLDFDPLMGADENSDLDGYEPRNLERGARLVAIFPNAPNVVIQLPRGNLESISPRALVLPYVMLKIRNRDYFTALDVMRKQRVDMNLIVDLDPIDFLENGGAETFLKQVKKIDNINLFLSCLIDSDITLWKYPVPSWITIPKALPKISCKKTESSKVNKICVKMRETMLNSEKERIVKDGHFLLPILSTFAKEIPPKLHEALFLIKNSISLETLKYPTKKSLFLSDHVQNSIQYLAFLASYEMLFDTAIGMYDYDLAKAVARHSQMDPKQYLPLLKRWKEMPVSSARFEVDVKLKRYDSALRHLVHHDENVCATDLAQHFDKCLKFIEEHKLYALGLQLFKDDENLQRSILGHLGEHLLSERKAAEALTVFLASNPKYFDGAKRAARACGDWKTFFACGDGINQNVCCGEAIMIAESIATKTVSTREERERYASAARILLDYGRDIPNAIEMLISAQMWSESRRIAYLHNRADLARRCVDAALSYATLCIDDLSERAATFEETNNRYAEVIVLRRKAFKDADDYSGRENTPGDSASVFSTQSALSISSLRSTASASSTGSIASVSTVISVSGTSTFSFTGDIDTMKHKSKFNKIGRDRKKKKKKAPVVRRVKPGSEEELNELVITLSQTCPDEDLIAVISETIVFLLQSGKESCARALFEAYCELEVSVAKSQTKRLDCDRREHEEGNIVEHSSEKTVNAISCKHLPAHVNNLMSFFH